MIQTFKNLRNLFLLFILLFFSFYLTAQQSGTFTDSRDGKTYKTIKIGNQIWMAENIAYRINKGCWAYDNDESKVAEYGYLYDWETAKSVCPTGWHLPDKSEFETLLNNVSSSGNTAYKTMEQSGNSGFCVLLGSHRTVYGYFDFIGMYGYYWSSSQVEEVQAWRMFVSSDYPEVSMFYSPLSCGFSVRRLKDN